MKMDIHSIKKNDLQLAVNNEMETFEAKREAAIRAYKVYGITTTARLYEDDTAERYFHIYYNPSKQAAERERLEQRIEKLKQFLVRHVG